MDLKYINKLFSEAVEKNTFTDLMIGKCPYLDSFPRRDCYDEDIPDISCILYSGIYEYYNNFDAIDIKTIFEKSLFKLMQGSLFELMMSFGYLWRHFSCESRGTAPFFIDIKCYIELQKNIIANKNALENYKEYNEFGKNLKNGAWEYIHNINDSIFEDYRKKFISL